MRDNTKKGETAYLNRVVKRLNRASGYTVDSDPYRWEYQLGDQTGEVIAHNRAEARGKIKYQLGLKKRLPKEIKIERLERVPD